MGETRLNEEFSVAEIQTIKKTEQFVPQIFFMFVSVEFLCLRRLILPPHTPRLKENRQKRANHVGSYGNKTTVGQGVKREVQVLRPHAGRQAQHVHVTIRGLKSVTQGQPLQSHHALSTRLVHSLFF